MGSGLWVLVFLHADDGPARLGELMIGVLVTLPIARDFRAPEALIDLRWPQVIGGAMPETAVEEDRDLSAREDKVGCTTQCRERPDIHPVPQPESVHRRAQCTLWPGIATAVGPHDNPGDRRGGPGFLHR